jgi:aldose 1-epimerase
MYSINKVKVKDKEFTIIDIFHDNIEVTLMDYGATILSIQVPDKKGEKELVVLAFDKLENYIENDIYLNAIVGPTAGRIGNASFTIDGQVYELDKNFMETENLHGGKETLSYKTFNYEIMSEDNQTQVVFTYRKPDVTSYYPANVDIKIIYTIKNSKLIIEFIGETDYPSLLNLTNHAYFNLSGNMKSNILDHHLQINTDKVCPLNDKFIPIGLETINRSHLDFVDMKPISDNFFEGITDIPEKGIDNPYYFETSGIEHKQATLYEPKSGRQLDVYTTYPCIVVYTHNHPDTNELLFGIKQKPNMAICFETQNPPNGINVEGLEDSIVRPNKAYYHKTIYKFSVKED